MTRDLNYDDRVALYEAIAHLRSAEHGLIVAIRCSYVSVAIGGLNTVRADIEAALKALDAAEARLEPPTSVTVPETGRCPICGQAPPCARNGGVCDRDNVVPIESAAGNLMR